MAASYITVGSGDHHVIALHGWFGSALGWDRFSLVGHSMSGVAI
jgi:hypothetical protein